jgi:cytoskeletal protein CcmA (bactofilin family)
MAKKHNPINNELIDTIIGEDCHFQGTIHTQRSIRIEGRFEGGEINAQGDVIIGENSQVKATIFAKRVIVSGEVIGNIETTSGLQITNTGKVYGDLKGDQLLIEEGAIYKGKVNMDVITSKNSYEGDFSLKKVS